MDITIFKNIIIILLFIISAIFFWHSKDLKYKNNYLLKCASYILLYIAIFILFSQYFSIVKIKQKIDIFVTVSATLSGFVFAGLAIILALIEFEHIKNLFKNDFLDNLFYKGYGSIIMFILHIFLYFIIIMFDIDNQHILVFYQFIFGLSILLLALMVSDFVYSIKQLKKNLKRKK
ncbi:hypothetical protein B5F09_07050 [Erysipelatoclostridium sp. An173]|uniref:hypothetical protein n=1 Tax=Erysipelatoclostridium sp. An173 TaxID=1965571 RepID=UPI000B3A41D3|nr:hypothetical protein [Erysipelatoclostridium sp. An173]OUP77116.1 hypothetical protein B5F09_07050 [Erysipelatoclostridium sp. An173]